LVVRYSNTDANAAPAIPTASRARSLAIESVAITTTLAWRATTTRSAR
jgi:hypothetical protein